MIGVYLLTELLQKYDIDANKVVKNNENILTYGEYIDIDNTLDYLKNELHISSRNIEKCPSILYRNVSTIKSNIQFLSDVNIKFTDIETCLHVLSTEPSDLKDTYDYVFKNYGKDAILKVRSILRINIDRIKGIEKLNIPFKNKSDNLSVAVGRNSLEEIEKIIKSKEFKKYPHLFTSTTLAQATLTNIQDIIGSEEFKKYSHLFTSQVLAQATIRDIQDIIGSEEFKKHSDLFTSQVLARSTLKDIQDIIGSEEFKKYPHLFTSSTLAQATIRNIQDIIGSEELKKYPHLFTSETLVHARLKDIQDIIGSEEFKKYPHLFTSETLVYARLKDIQDIIGSEEFKSYPHLFTSTTLARSTLKDIQDIIGSEEFKNYPHLFTSTTLVKATLKNIKDIIGSEYFKNYPHLFTSEVLAHAKLEDIRVLLNLPYWNDERYVKLLTSSILSIAKKMCDKLPKLFEMAEYYGIDKFLTTNYLRKSLSQNFAIINYLNDNNIPLVNDGKLNSIFAYQPGVLKKKYDIDLNELIKKYPYNEGMFNRNISGGNVK